MTHPLSIALCLPLHFPIAKSKKGKIAMRATYAIDDARIGDNLDIDSAKQSGG